MAPGERKAENPGKPGPTRSSAAYPKIGYERSDLRGHMLNLVIGLYDGIDYDDDTYYYGTMRGTT